MERREHVRIPVSRAVRLIGSDGVVVAGTATDLSLAGMAVLCRHPAERDVLLRIAMPLGLPHKIVSFTAGGRVVERRIAGEHFRLGLRFETFHGDSKDLLESFIDYRYGRRKFQIVAV